MEKEFVISRLQQVESELEVLTNDYKTLTAHLKDIETKIIFIRGKKEELTFIANELNKETGE